MYYSFLEVFFVFCCSLFGIIFGSFLNVVIYRVPVGKTISKGRSMCMSCGHTLSFLDLFPIFSWLFLRGRCRYCKTPISSRYIKIETFSGLLFFVFSFCFRKNLISFLNFDNLQLIIHSLLLLILLLIAVSNIIPVMMIYHDTKKSFKTFPITLLILYVISLINLIVFFHSIKLSISIKPFIIFWGIFPLSCTIGILILKFFFRWSPFKYSKNELLFDCSNLLFLCIVMAIKPFFFLDISFDTLSIVLQFFMALLFYIVYRILSINKDFSKYSGIINTIVVVILFCLR